MREFRSGFFFVFGTPNVQSLIRKIFFRNDFKRATRKKNVNNIVRIRSVKINR